MAQRRTPRGGPGGSRRPGERGGAPRPRPATVVPAATASRRPRFTGRAAILVLVVAVLTVSYASSMRAYLQQRSHIADLKAQIAAKAESIDELEREKRRWHDPAFIEAQARERFGYLMPGETSYVVLGANGRPLEGETQLPDASSLPQQAPTAWWTSAWDSVELAGNPPRAKPPPAAEIVAPEEPEQ